MRVLAAILLLCVPTSADKPKYAPLPSAILMAKKVYIQNDSGVAEIGDQAFSELSKWGRFRVVADKNEADLTFVLNIQTTERLASTPDISVSNQVGNTTVKSGGARTYSYTSGSTTLTVLIAESGERLWGNTKPWSRKGAARDLMIDLRKRIEAQEKR